MKPLEPPPDWLKTVNEDPGVFDRFYNDSRAMDLLRKSQDEYPYWDKIKHWPMPEGVKPALIWGLRQLAALGKIQTLPLKDNQGKPFTFWLPDRAQELLHFVDRKAPGEILVPEGLPGKQEREGYIVQSLMEESIASSRLEGAATTRKAAKEMIRSGRRPRNRAELMVLNNFHAIEQIRKWKERELTPGMMHELHGILTQNTMDEPDAIGRWRRTPEDDDVNVVDFDQSILHVPPRGAEIPERMNRLIRFANSESESPFVHPVIKAILLHFWIGYDHPYVDGNGRLGRALFYWYLLRNDYWVFEFVSISRTVLKSPGMYKRAYLYSEVGNNDATYFLMYNLRAIKSALEDVHRFIADRQKLLRRSSDLLRQLPGINYRQRELLMDAFKKTEREYTIRGHQRTHGVVYQTARADLLHLMRLGYLEMHKSGNRYVFLSTPKLHALQREPSSR